MRRRFLAQLIVIGGSALLSACGPRADSVIFVTNTSLGINLDQKPPVASIAYDRTEGYIAPRYENGGLPPVVASIETGGNIFAPKIRQVYATGAAAVKAVGTMGAADGPLVLTGDPNKKRMAFFGTTTTVGLKAGFSEATLPDSLIIGYNRKEFSFIPLGEKVTAGVKEDVYPSVIASIDTTLTATSLNSVGLTNQQFFATGQAAETLAKNPAIQRAFKAISADSVTSTLTAQQRVDAIALGQRDATNQQSRVDKIMEYAAPAGAFDLSKWQKLVDDANAKTPGMVGADIKALNNADKVRARIADDQPLATGLAAAIPVPA